MKEQIFYGIAEKHKAKEWMFKSFKRANFQVMTIPPFTRYYGGHPLMGQACWRKIQLLGLSQDYKDSNNEISKWLKHLFGLYF